MSHRASGAFIAGVAAAFQIEQPPGVSSALTVFEAAMMAR